MRPIGTTTLGRTTIGTTRVDRSRDAPDDFQHRTVPAPERDVPAFGEDASTKNRTPATAASADRTGSRTAGDSTEDGDPVVLLHVEPDARSAELLAAFAERFVEDLTVRSVDGMGPALDAVDGIDCVVTEQRLPDGSGVELVERLRKRGVDAPVVFHTTCREQETGSRALEAGADAYFSKRSKRGQYNRIFERLRGLIEDDTPDSRRATTVSTDTPDSSAGASRSEKS